MAQALKFNCSNCKFSIVSWSDGSPYFLDYKGKPQFFHHPNEDQLEYYKMQYMYDAITAIMKDIKAELLPCTLTVIEQYSGENCRYLKETLPSIIRGLKLALKCHPMPKEPLIPDYDKLNERTGNLSWYLCLDCGREFKCDARRTTPQCTSRKCKSLNATPTYKLAGKVCPKCKKGQFNEGVCVAVS